MKYLILLLLSIVGGKATHYPNYYGGPAPVPNDNYQPYYTDAGYGVPQTQGRPNLASGGPSNRPVMGGPSPYYGMQAASPNYESGIYPDYDPSSQQSYWNQQPMQQQQQQHQQRQPGQTQQQQQQPGRGQQRPQGPPTTLEPPLDPLSPLMVQMLNK